MSGQIQAEGEENLPPVQEAGSRAFVWVVWGVLSLATAGLIARFGSDVPIWDDYVITPVQVGDRPITLGWLWEQCNEHRIALSKLILVGAQRLAGNDVRAGMFLSAGTLSVLAAALVWLAGRIRGGTRPSDAVIPLLLLHPGHVANLLWGIQFSFVLPTALGSAYLIPIARRATWPSPATAALAGFGLVLLPLCGGTGLVYVPPLALWLFGAAWGTARSGRPGAALIALSPVPGLVVTALYFVGFEKGSHPEAEGGLVDHVRTGVQFLTSGVGIPAAWGWPWSGAATLALVGLALYFLIRAWVFQPVERPRVFGLVAFLAAMGAMAAAVGWGRGWAGPLAGFQDRYVTMATPLWCWLVFAFRLYAPASLGGLVVNALFAASCVLYWPNAQMGLTQGRDRAETTEALARDLRAGLPPYRIVRRYIPFLHPSQDDALKLLPMLHRAGIGEFKALVEDPPFHNLRLPTAPDQVSLARWDAQKSTAYVTGVSPQLIYRLPSPRQVAGVRIRYSHRNRANHPARFMFTWKQPGQLNYPDTEQRYAIWSLPTGDGKETTVWVDDIVSEFRIQPDNQPCEFHIVEILVLTP
jgi:hypothetical protein